MILDNQVNFLWLSNLLHSRESFFRQLTEILDSNSIAWGLLSQSKDIWCRDYMPIQVDETIFIQFRYQPDYLQSKKFLSTISNPSLICNSIGIEATSSTLVIDGGNIIKGKSWVILTDKVFKENPTRTPKQILIELEHLFNVKPIIIPKEPYDWTGHADAVLRYYNESTVLINSYGNLLPAYSKKLHKTLKAEGIQFIEIPFKPNKVNYDSAYGYYINYLHLANHIILPAFGIPEDDLVIKQFRVLFPTRKILSIPCSDLAKEGGLLNCISWSIFVNQTQSCSLN